MSPTYAPLTQAQYTEYYSTATYPYQNYIGPLYVLYATTVNDPSSASGGTYYHVYYYDSAWTNLQGRGFAGFNIVIDLDSRNGVERSVYYERAFPYTGMAYETQSGTSTEYISRIVGTPAETTLDGTTNNERYFPYFSNWTKYRWENGGSEDGDLISTTSTNYTYDDYGNATNIDKTITDNDPGSPFGGDTWTTDITNTTDVDTTHWCLGLFTETQVAYSDSISSGDNVTRTKAFTPDTTNCRYSQIVTEPSSSSYKVTETLTYDNSGGGSGFGDLTEDSVTGIGMSARNTYINWTTAGQFPLNVTDPSGAETQFAYNYNYGKLSTLTDPNGLVTSWQYDDFGRKSQETRPDSTYTTWGYTLQTGDMARLIITEQPHDTAGTVITTTKSWFTMIDQPYWRLSTLSDGTTSWTEDNVYDSLGRIVNSYFPTRSSSVGEWTYTYDILNRLTEAQRPISSTNSTAETTTYQYAGRTRTVTDPNSNTRTIVTDVNGWQRKTKDAYSYTVTTAYDAAGGKTGVSDSAGNTLWSGSYSYGIAPFNTATADADLGSWSYTYDALGELTGWTDAKSQSFTETYDALSRPLTRSEPDYYTQWTWGSSSSSHNIGQLASVCTGLGTNPSSCTSSGYSESEAYDSDGRPYQRSIVIPSDGTFTYTWAYSGTTGLLNTLTYPTTTSSYALQLQYAYSYGIPTSITDVSDSPNITLWAANSTNAAGQITEETLGNGIVTNRTYDTVTSWLGALTAGVSGGSGVENQGWLYDEVGNVTQRQDNNLGLTENFYYDNDYRLTSSTLGGTGNLSVTYGSNGNITSRSDVAGGASWTYSSSQIHAVTQAGSSAYTYAYDANGNATSRNGYTVNWSSYNYPTSIGTSSESVAFAYGPGRQRWQQNYNSGTETTDYIGGLMEQVFSGGTTTYRHYIYAGTEPVAVYARTSTLTNTWSYFVSDHQGSVSTITNSSGGVDVNESFAAFGARRNPSTWSGAPSSSDLNTIAGSSRQGYTFQTALGQSMGLNHMNGRVQDAITGRFLSADPHIQDPTNAQSYNRYSYVVNNPLTLTDPSGFEYGDGECDNSQGGQAATCIDGGGGNLPEADVYGGPSLPGSLSSVDPNYLPDPGVNVWTSNADSTSASGGGANGGPAGTPQLRPITVGQATSYTPPQTAPQMPCGFWGNLGSSLTSFGQLASNTFGNLADVGIGITVTSAAVTFVAPPAAPGAAVFAAGGLTLAGIGGVGAAAGGTLQYLGGILSGNQAAVTDGFITTVGSVIESVLPPIPTAVDPTTMIAQAAGAAAPAATTCH